ncbi:MAG: sterol desaturase family protein [Elusimicrobia bacterium]|nr:sterol desaturase family protein [Elusimicrobiota bacterium]
METFLEGPLRLGLLLGALVAGLAAEALVPLRQVTQPKLRRAAVNLALAGVGALALRFLLLPIVLAVSADVTERGWGLLPWLGLTGPAALSVSILAMDYTLYLWHVANHRWPFLWRFHGVHHADLDMDVTTASRFHVGELALSAGYRSAQVALLGADPLALALFETAVTLAAQFHHANVRLPFRLERRLNLLVVTPRMHGVHHSIVQDETNSNYATIFSFWDRVHATLRLNVPQRDITIGVPYYRELGQLTFWRSLAALPLRDPAWRLPDGSVPVRKGASGPLSKAAA